MKPFEPDEPVEVFLERHKKCDDQHTPAPRRKPTPRPFVLDDDDAMSQDEDYDEVEYEEYDDYEETEYIGKSSIF